MLTDTGLLFEKPKLRGRFTPRDYQLKDHDRTFSMWDDGTTGCLTRAFTCAGKTFMACMKADTWLARGDDYRVMVISYEQQLVEQFAEEVERYLGITPLIEMEKSEVSADAIPPITIASRQSLLRRASPDIALLEQMGKHGFQDLNLLSALGDKKIKKYLKHIDGGGDLDQIHDDLEVWRDAPEIANGYWSRLHKFDWRLNWLIVFDEGHKHTYKMASVGHIVDWFDQNPVSRRLGMTATPKRFDGVSIGDKMFPGISLDYPLYSTEKACGVKDGWAVPYVQRYIEIEGIDFKNIKRAANGDFDEAALEVALNTETILAKLVQPLLDLVGDRKTLIFSPGVSMAKSVAAFINARVEAKCTCGKVKWYPRPLIEDGAACECGVAITSEMVTKKTDQAKQLDGSSHRTNRKPIYEGHQNGEFQFLSICGLCREGYNDPDIACVAIFRPVSKKASSLAEQMKGRGCRPHSSIAKLLGDCPDTEARLLMNSQGPKPNCLIVDLVGITGLADCASTVAIYSEGLPDEVIERAEKELLKSGSEGETAVEEAIESAKRAVAEEREKLRKEREEAERRQKEAAERRAALDAQVKYSAHERGYGANVDPNMASDKQLGFIGFLGMNIKAFITRAQARRIIGQLRNRVTPEEVARTNRLEPEQWKLAKPSLKQADYMGKLGIKKEAKTGYDASLLISARKDPAQFVKDRLQDIADARSAEELTFAARDAAFGRDYLKPNLWSQIMEAGSKRRSQFPAPKSFDF